jgi:hypothetical protein
MPISSFLNLNRPKATTIPFKKTNTTCKLTTRCSDYIHKEKPTKKCHNEIIENIEAHFHNNIILKPCAIIDKTFFLEVFLERNAYRYLKNKFIAETEGKLRECILHALPNDIEKVEIQLTRSIELEEDEIMFKFGANVSHPKNGDIALEIYKKTSKGQDPKALAVAYKGAQALEIDRFILEEAQEPVAASYLRMNQSIGLKTEVDDSIDSTITLPIVDTPDGWSHQWNGNELTISFNESGIEESIQFIVEINEKNWPESQESVINNANPNFNSANDNLISQSDIEKANFDQELSLPPSIIANDNIDNDIANFENDMPLPPTITASSPQLLLQLEYVVCGGSYLNKYGLDKVINNDLREQSCSHKGLVELGIDKIGEVIDMTTIKFNDNKTLNLGRNNKETSMLSNYTALKTDGKSDSITPYGFSREHACLAIDNEEKVTISPIANSTKLPTYILDKRSATLLTDDVKLSVGSSLLVGCFVFKLVCKNI